MKKRFFISSTLILLLALSSQFAFATESATPALTLNASPLAIAANVSDGYLYLPVRAVCEALGYDVNWSQKDQTVSLISNGNLILLNLKEGKVYVNKHDYYMAGGPSTITNRLYMPSDFFSENLGLKVTWDKVKGKVYLDSVKLNSININTVKEATKANGLTLTSQYPQISGMSNIETQGKINAIFKNLAVNAGNEGRKNAAELAKEPNINDGRPNMCETYFNYHVAYNRNGVFSVVFLDYQYAGGAHGITIQSSYTIDLATGNQLALADLFKSGSDYAAPLSSSVKAQLAERGLTDALFAPFDQISANQNFYLSNNGVVVYFEQYEILPYAAGIQEFATDFTSLNGILLNPAMFSNEGLLYQNERLGFSLQFPIDWNWHYEILPVTGGIVVNYVPSTNSLDKAMLFSIIKYGTEKQWAADWHSLEQKAGVINGDVYSYIGRADFPYDLTNPSQKLDSDSFSAMYEKADSIVKSFKEIPNEQKSATMLLDYMKDLGKMGKIINSTYPVENTVIEDVISVLDQPDKTAYVAAAKGTYSDFVKQNVTFGFNKGSQIFEARSFDPSLGKITLSKAMEVLGKPDYIKDISGEKVIGFITTKDYRLLLVFKTNTNPNSDLVLDHYSVLFPRGTVNLMSGDPGRQW